MSLPPNPRLQRTRSASPPSPLSRQPLGRKGGYLRTLASLSFLLLLAGRVLADSDGHFCTSEGYLAYELRGWSVPEKKHVLKIIRVGGHQGIGEPFTLALGDFQVHGMRCDPHEILISSWHSTYVVELSASAPPETKSVLPHQPGQMSQELVAASITDSRRSTVVEIPLNQIGNTYELQIVHSEEDHTAPGKGGLIRHRTTSKLVEKDETGRILQEKVIYAGTSDETVD
jgi:hypothetical protein